MTKNFKKLFKDFLLLFLVLAAGCYFSGRDSDEIQNPGAAADFSRLIYGNDDRLDYYDSGVTEVQQKAADAVFIMVSSNNLTDNGDYYTLSTIQYTDQSEFDPNGLCSGTPVDEPFRTQPTAGFCTAFLVGRDLAATAGHCVDQVEIPLSAVRFLLYFRMNSNGTPPSTSVSKSRVYSLSDVVSYAPEGENDHALVRLDREVVGIAPLEVRKWGKAAAGTDLVVIGHPRGLPVKISGGAKVKDVFENFFTANLDTYGGNSGSPVFDAGTMTVQGILVRGNIDYIKYTGPPSSCFYSNQCSDDNGCSSYYDWDKYENVTHINIISRYFYSTTKDGCGFVFALNSKQKDVSYVFLFWIMIIGIAGRKKRCSLLTRAVSRLLLYFPLRRSGDRSRDK